MDDDTGPEAAIAYFTNERNNADSPVAEFYQLAIDVITEQLAEPERG